MKPCILTLIKNENGNYHTVFKTRHARKIYLAISVSGDTCTVTSCRYLDRSTRKTPKALTFAPFGVESLAEKIAKELDGVFYGIRFMENEILSEEELISRFLEKEKKKILLMLRDGKTLRIVFRNKTHRSIYLEIRLDHGQALIFDCHYADDRSQVVPYGLTAIRFRFSLQELLRIVNEELEGGFTDVAVSEVHTIVLDRPICGSI
jgi:hypothetical protein